VIRSCSSWALTFDDSMGLILGLDVSTAVTGYAIIDKTNGNLVLLDNIDTRALSFWDSTAKVEKTLQSIKHLGSYEDVYVEESLQQFRSGFSSAHTLSTLAKMNGVVSYIASTTLGVRPRYISSANARAKCGIKLIRASTPEQKKDSHFTKKQIFDHMLFTHPHLQQCNWPMTKATPKNPSGRLQDQCYDMMDAYVIAHAAYLGCKYSEL